MKKIRINSQFISKYFLNIKWFIILIISLIICLIIILNRCNSSSNTIELTQNNKIDLTPTTIHAITEIGEMEFLSINHEEMIDTIRKGFFSNDELIRIYYGTLRLGINFKEAKPNFIRVIGDSITAILPPIKLLDHNFIDETRTLSFYEKGKWNAQAKNDMYQRAYQQMKKKCMTDSIKIMTENLATEQIKNILTSMGLKKVHVMCYK